MDSQKVVIVKRANKPPAEPEPLSQPTRQPEIDQPEQPDPIVHLESLVEPTRLESVYGSGWSVTERAIRCVGNHGNQPVNNYTNCF